MLPQMQHSPSQSDSSYSSATSLSRGESGSGARRLGHQSPHGSAHPQGSSSYSNASYSSYVSYNSSGTPSSTSTSNKQMWWPLPSKGGRAWAARSAEHSIAAADVCYGRARVRWRLRWGNRLSSSPTTRTSSRALYNAAPRPRISWRYSRGAFLSLGFFPFSVFLSFLRIASLSSRFLALLSFRDYFFSCVPCDYFIRFCWRGVWRRDCALSVVCVLFASVSSSGGE
ncbi:hypothetical protein B0H13DRAFT_971730 [Mycena leptocephala]|nr:hypothetical protein B0H13DRAFT_971730 [Mycena leptocephala]